MRTRRILVALAYATPIFVFLAVYVPASRDISGYTPELQRIFRAMKRYGLIVADNGSDMYISGTMDGRWNNDVLNPAFHSLTADDFEVIQLGWGQAIPPNAPVNFRIVR